VGKFRTEQEKEVRADIKLDIRAGRNDGVLDFQKAQAEGNIYANKYTAKSLDKIEASLLTGAKTKCLWSKELADPVVGGELALAYATGYLDALLVRAKHRIIT